MTEEEVFQAALELADPADRTAYLETACGGDAEFRRQVEDLLAAHFKSGPFLDEPVGRQTGADSATPADDNTVSLHANLGADAVADATKPDEEPDDLRFLQPSSRPDSLGRIGHYEVLEVLGRGGFGIVLRAFDEILQRVVALKVLAPAIAATSPARKRFLREARSSAKVRHENVVQVYAVEEQPLPYLVMEFIPGETLQQRLDRTGPLETPEIVRIGREIAAGLAAAHATDLIHRDIKPGNILLEGGCQRVKITDFGLARASDDASLTQSGVVAGTPMYMAPEQAKGERLDHRADLFSLGSVLYVMAAGRPPFRASTTFAVLKRVAEDDPRPIREVIPEIPRWLCDIVARLHAKKPEARFQTAHEVAEVLADCEARLKANAKVQNFSRIPRSKPAAGTGGRWKWAAAALLLPILALLALALTELTGVTHLLFGPHAPQVRDDPAGKPIRPTTTGELSPKGNHALHFDGEGNYVDIPSLSYDGGPVTVEALIRVESQHLAPIVKGIGKEMIGLWLNEKMLGVSGGTRATPEYSTLDIALDRRIHHVAGVFDGADIRLYLDGKRVGVRARGVLTPVPGGGFAVGGEPGLGRGAQRIFFGGIIGEIRVSKVVRYDKDFTPALRHGPDEETLALYHCDEGEGDTLADSSGHGHHGKIIGATWVKTDGEPLAIAFLGGDANESGAKDKPAPPAVAPFTDADARRIASLPTAEQSEEVGKELRRRNPGFDGTLVPNIEGDAVIGLNFSTDRVTDVSPVRALAHLQTLQVRGSSWFKGSLADLKPLNGMPLTTLDLTDNGGVTDLSALQGIPLTDLSIEQTGVTDLTPLHGMQLERLMAWGFLGSDLTPLKGMPLKWLNCGGRGHNLDLTPLAGLPLDFLCINVTEVSDLTPLRGAPLTTLLCSNTPVSDLTPLRGGRLKHLQIFKTKVSDLSPLKGMPLAELECEGSGVTDLSPLKDLPLTEIVCDFQPERDAKILRAIKTLVTINGKLAADFWREVDGK